MARNEVCQLETPSETYHITLTAFEKEKQLYAINEKEVLKMAEELKVRGNNAYKMNKLRLAQLYYDRCMIYIEGIAKSEQDGSCTDLLGICNLNLCLVYMKLENYPKVVSYSTTVLWTDCDSVKALYRRAQAYDKQGFHEEAINDLNRLLDIETDNEFAKRLLGVVKSNKKSRENQEKVNMRTIFQKIEENHALEAANAVPTVSVWDEATDTCPQELATEEAYSVYKDALDEQEKARQAEVAARKAEYEAANPSKKKKKRKKKKKAVISEVAITEMEEIKADEDKPEVVPEPDEGMTYEVTAERTFVTKSENSKVRTDANGGSSSANGDTEIPLEIVADLIVADVVDAAVTKLEDIKLNEVNLVKCDAGHGV